MANWKTTADIRRAAEEVFNKLSRGEMEPDEAKALGAQLRTVTKLICVELDVTKLRGGKIGKALKSINLSL